MPNACGGSQTHPAYGYPESKDPLIVYSQKTELEYSLRIKNNQVESIEVESVSGNSNTITRSGKDWTGRFGRVILPAKVRQRIALLEAEAQNLALQPAPQSIYIVTQFRIWDGSPPIEYCVNLLEGKVVSVLEGSVNGQYGDEIKPDEIGWNELPKKITQLMKKIK